MFGLTILFFLWLWVYLTIVAMNWGWKIGGIITERLWGRWLGMIIGFMFLMGWFIVSEVIGYIATQNKLNQLCKKAGLTVYITPEEWRKQIGEEEWQSLPPKWENISSDLKFEFNGKVYHGFSRDNRRVYAYKTDDNNKDGVNDYDMIYVDNQTKKVLFNARSFSAGVLPVGISLEGLEFWINNLKDCGWEKWPEHDRFFHRKYINYEAKN